MDESDFLYVLLLVAFLLLLNICLTFIRTKKEDNTVPEDPNQEDPISQLGETLKEQKRSIIELNKDIQTFREPLLKLNRYLSGGTLAGQFGEWGLESIINDVLPQSKFEQNVEVIPNTGYRVEFVIKLNDGLLLPIDAKFSSALYDNYIQAADSGNGQAVKLATTAIERSVKQNAADIELKYMQTGITVEFGVMFIPSESLMQLIDSIENLRENIFRDSRILMMGPNTLAAYLISINMTFRSLALNERAAEIFKEFGKLEKEFTNFKSSTEELEKKAKAMLKSVDSHITRESQMAKAIKKMKDLDQETEKGDENT